MQKFLLLLFVLLQACSSNESAQSTEQSPSTEALPEVATLTADQIKAAGIAVGSVESRTLSNVIHVTGMLDVPPQNMVSITAPFGGFLRNTTLLQGMRVRKGQAIATIENPEYIQLQQDFLETRSQAEFLESEYERQQELARENVNAQKTLQKSKADAASMRARNNGLRAKLKMIGIQPEQLNAATIGSTIELRSPIDGYVTQVNSTIGAFVSPNEVIFRIVDTEHLHAELVAFERDITRIRVGQRIRFRLTNEPTERTARVYLIGREINGDRSVRIHGHLDKEDDTLIPGMYLKAVIEAGGTPVASLPEEAVVNFEGKNFIIVQEENDPLTFRMKEVNTGIKDAGYVEILSPDELANRKVVVNGAYKILAKITNATGE